MNAHTHSSSQIRERYSYTHSHTPPISHLSLSLREEKVTPNNGTQPLYIFVGHLRECPMGENFTIHLTLGDNNLKVQKGEWFKEEELYLPLPVRSNLLGYSNLKPAVDASKAG